MIPGPMLIKKCPQCSGLIAEDSIASGNTFGATFWTDGKVYAPMLPDQPWLVKCPHCQARIWRDEQELVEEIELSEFYKNENTKYAHTKPSQTLDSADYTIQLNEMTDDTADKHKEKYLRLQLWHIGNDPRRFNNHAEKESLSVDEVDNLNALYALLDPENEENRLLMAEIKRELGEFNAALTLLNEDFDKDTEQAADIIRTLAQNKNVFVAKMQFEI